MARLRPALFGLVLSATCLGLARGRSEDPPQKKATGQQAVSPEFSAAGLCARCHVVSVLEWGVSGHLAVEPDCRGCHGPSDRHAANERNEVKPDRVAHGDQIAKDCIKCHEKGCPQKLKTDACQACHHHHALFNPERTPETHTDAEQQASRRRRNQYRKAMAEGEKLVRAGNWAEAMRAFQLARNLRPADKQASARITFCKNRLSPDLAGFRPVGDDYDPRTGLWREVEVAGNGLRMLLVPSGEFDVGDDDLPASRPVHTVRVRSFYLGKFEITQRQWTQLIGSNPSRHQGTRFPQRDRMPVENVSWADCRRFIAKLNAVVPGGGFRLPTEAEWEYAARAGSSALNTNPDSLDQAAWFRRNSADRPRPADGARAGNPNPAQRLTVDDYSPRPVGTRSANAWGFHDLQGNVWEWTSDVFRRYLSGSSGAANDLQSADLRSVRGGSYVDSALFLRPGFRYGVRPGRRMRCLGLRVARDVPVAADTQKATDPKTPMPK